MTGVQKDKCSNMNYLTEIQIEYTYVNNRNKTSTTVKHPIVKDEILMIKRLQQIYTTWPHELLKWNQKQ